MEKMQAYKGYILREQIALFGIVKRAKVSYW